MQTVAFEVLDIHRKTSGALVVVGIQSVDGKVYPAAFKVANVLRDASARELSKFLGQLANTDARGQVVSFTTAERLMTPADLLDVATLAVSESRRVSQPVAARDMERVDAFDVLGLSPESAR